MIGQTVKNYKILEKISQNEFIEAYRAVDLLLGRIVLLKIFGGKSLRELEKIEAFHFEAATLAKLNQTNIPALHSLIESDDLTFMVQEFVEGESFDKFLQRRGKIPFEEAVPLFVEILDSIDYSHRFGVVHGNLNNSKVILTDTGSVKILGFGKHKIVQTADTDKDINQIGAMLFEAITGKSLIAFENSCALKDKLAEDARKFLYSVNPFIPEEIKSAIVKAVYPTQSKRFQNAADFREVLLAYSFDEAKIEDEISTSEKLVADALPFNRLQPFNLTNDPGNSTENRTVTSKPAAETKNVAVYSVNFSPNKNKSAENKDNLNTVATNEKIVPPSKSSVKNSGKNRFAIAGAGILAVLVLQVAWQFSIVQNDNLQIVKAPVEIRQPDKPMSEVKSEYEAENRRVIEPPKISAPIEPIRNQMKPTETIFKKKAPPETRAERLRRVEKALTGI